MRTCLVLVSTVVAALPAAELISGRDLGGFAAGTSVLRGISNDASVVLFESDGDQTGRPGDIFPLETSLYVRDRLGFRTRVAAGSPSDVPGQAQAALSGDGATIVWVEPLGIAAPSQITVLQGGVRGTASTSSLGVPGNGPSSAPAVSDDGRWVAFVSTADNLTGDGLPGVRVGDIFVKDRATGLTVCASLTPDGRADSGASTTPAIARNGRFVAFHSTSSELVAGTPAAFTAGVFVRDLVAGTTERIDLAGDGAPANQPPYTTYAPAISGDGRYVAFASAATNLVAGDTNGAIDVFVRDRVARTTVRVSVSGAGAQGDDHSLEPSLSLDGRQVCFRSYATTLVAGDTNSACDVFVRDRTGGSTIRVDFGWGGLQANGDALPGTRICGLGFAVAYTSIASNLVAGDPNGRPDVFLNANDPTWWGSTPFMLYVRTWVAAVRQRWLPSLRANG